MLTVTVLLKKLSLVVLSIFIWNLSVVKHTKELILTCYISNNGLQFVTYTKLPQDLLSDFAVYQQ